MKRSLLACFAIFICVSCFSQSIEDTLQLKAFMDGVIETHLRDKHIAGATVSIVKDGKMLLSKGYGFSDIKKQKRVSADSTLFRIGSISKMFTWISVMELVAQGKLKLDEDINHYLKDFKIPETYPEPITLKHLMTHTPGFEDKVIGLFGRDSSSMRPLGELLSSQLPARVRAPGTLASYSNHGTGLAAYIVEQVSGKSFNSYVENNILIPLRMHSTTFKQPVPSFLKTRSSRGYAYSNDEYVEKPFEYVPLYPVGGASTTATDMVRFMTALLNSGRFEGNSILDSATLAFMKTPAHRHHPSVNPMRYGFIDMSRNGVEVIGHGGDTFWFHSMMALFPESNTGIFLSFNTETGSGVSGIVLKQFMDRYYPEQNLLKSALHVNKQYLDRFAGAYRVNRFAHHDITAVSSMFNDLQIAVIDSTKLKVNAFGEIKYYIPTDSFVFREEHSSEIIAFKQSADKEITQLFIGNLPILALDKVKGARSASLHLVIFGATVVLSVIMLFYWPITSRARRGYEPMGSMLTLPTGAKIVGWLTYFLWLVFYVGLLVVMSDPNTIVYAVPTGLKILLIVPFVIALLTLIMLLQLYRIWSHWRYQLWSRLFYVIITLVSMAALWQLYYWNFIGYHF